MTYYQQQLQVWQQQMTVYAQLTATNPEAAAQMTMPPPPPPPPPSMGGQQAQQSSATTPVGALDPKITTESGDIDPKSYLPKASGNKDAYEISGPADVYFAQLKRDSAIRSDARRAGDLETANKPFADIGVQALTNILSYELIKKRRDQVAESGGEFETSRDEMIIPYADVEENIDITYTGVSYKQKLMEMRKKKSGQNGPQAAAIPTPESTVEKAAPAPVVISEPEPAPVESVPELKSETPEEPETEEEGKPNFGLEVSDDFDDSSISAPSMEDAEETRKSIRTLMGLILKHRGGSGFGHGRLNEEESMKMTEVVGVVIALLRSEARMEVAAIAPPSCPASSSAVSTEAPSVPEYASTMEFPDTYKVTKAEEETSAVTMGFPDEFEVTQPEEEQISRCPMHSETDANTEVMQSAYDTLQSAAGDEKYGLREIGSDEITHIKDVLKDMRSVLMDELDNGIPE